MPVSHFCISHLPEDPIKTETTLAGQRGGRPALRGLLVVCVIIALELIFRLSGIVIPPIPPLLLAVVYAAFRGGTMAGLTGALLSLIWLAWTIIFSGRASVPGADDRLRLILYLAVLPAVAILTGVLKRRDDAVARVGTTNAALRAELRERERLERELREREAGFRLLFMANPLPMWVFDFATLQFIEVNNAAIARYGYSREEFLSRRMPDLWPPDKVDSRMKLVAERKPELMANPEWPGPAVSTHVRRDGSVVQVEVTWHTLTFSERPAVLSVAVDISERFRAGEALRASEALFRQMASISPVGIFRTDVSGDCLYVNERWCQITGLTPQQAAGRGWTTALHQDDRELVFAEWYRAAQERRVFKSEYRFQRSDGDVTWVLGQATAEQNKAGEVTGYVGTITDITERRRMEDALRASERRFYLAFHDNTSALIISRMSDGKLLEFNEAFQRLTGYSREELQSRSAPELNLWADPQQRDFVFRRLKQDGYLRDYEVVMNNRQGRKHYLLASYGVIDIDGEPCVLATSTDITERHQLEEERLKLLWQEQAALAQAEAAVRQLTAIQSITDAAVAMLEPDEMLNELLRRLSEVLRTDTATVLLLSEDGQQMQARASYGLEAEVTGKVMIPLGRGLAGRIAASREPMIFNDLSRTEVVSRPLREKVHSLMGAPLLASDKVIGVIHVGTVAPREFTADDLHLLQLVAERAASAIERTRLYEQVRDARDRLSHLSHQLIQAQEVERRRIARELHDELGQSLTAVQFGLLAVQQQMNSAAEAGKLQESIQLVDDAMQLVRHLSVSLRPSALDDLGLAEAVRWHAERLAQRTGLTIEVTATGLSQRLPASIETTCFRVVQEALTNIVRHAQAQHISISLHQQADRLTLTISDDGRGFDLSHAQARASRGESTGLVGMRERVQLSGGRMTISSDIGAGTVISAWFPLP